MKELLDLKNITISGEMSDGNIYDFHFMGTFKDLKESVLPY